MRSANQQTRARPMGMHASLGQTGAVERRQHERTSSTCQNLPPLESPSKDYTR